MEKVALLVLALIIVFSAFTVEPVYASTINKLEYIVIGMPGLKYIFTTATYRVMGLDKHYFILYPAYLVNTTDTLRVFTDLDGWIVNWTNTYTVGTTDYGGVTLSLYKWKVQGVFDDIDNRYTYVYMMRPSLESSSSGTLFMILIKYSASYGYAFILYRYNQQRVGAYKENGGAGYTSPSYSASDKAVISVLWSWYDKDGADNIFDINGYTIYTDTGATVHGTYDTPMDADPNNPYGVVIASGYDNTKAVAVAIYVDKTTGSADGASYPRYTVLDLSAIPNIVNVTITDIDNGVLYSGSNTTITLDTFSENAGIWRVTIYYEEQVVNNNGGDDPIEIPQLSFIVNLILPMGLTVLLVGLYGERVFPVLLPVIFSLSWVGLYPTWIGITLIFLAGVYALYSFFLRGSNDIGLDTGEEDES